MERSRQFGRHYMLNQLVYMFILARSFAPQPQVKVLLRQGREIGGRKSHLRRLNFCKHVTKGTEYRGGKLAIVSRHDADTLIGSLWTLSDPLPISFYRRRGLNSFLNLGEIIEWLWVILYLQKIQRCRIRLTKSESGKTEQSSKAHFPVIWTYNDLNIGEVACLTKEWFWETLDFKLEDKFLSLCGKWKKKKRKGISIL